MQTPTQALASELLAQDVTEWVASKRAQERPKWSWRMIALELEAATAGRVIVTGEAVRQWMADAEAVAS